MREIWIAVVEGVAGILSLAIAWALAEYAPEGWPKLGLILFLAGILLYPARYRQEGDRWIRIPYLFVGFCELAVVVFDRFKPPVQGGDSRGDN